MSDKTNNAWDTEVLCFDLNFQIIDQTVRVKSFRETFQISKDSLLGVVRSVNDKLLKRAMNERQRNTKFDKIDNKLDQILQNQKK
jgi:cobalamin biosynthesis protein CobT